MISLLIAFAVLVIGYFLYGRVTEKVFSIDDRPTPAVAKRIGEGVADEITTELNERHGI